MQYNFRVILNRVRFYIFLLGGFLGLEIPLLVFTYFRYFPTLRQYVWLLTIGMGLAAAGIVYYMIGQIIDEDYRLKIVFGVEPGTLAHDSKSPHSATKKTFQQPVIDLKKLHTKKPITLKQRSVVKKGDTVPIISPSTSLPSVQAGTAVQRKGTTPIVNSKPAEMPAVAMQQKNSPVTDTAQGNVLADLLVNPHSRVKVVQENKNRKKPHGHRRLLQPKAQKIINETSRRADEQAAALSTEQIKNKLAASLTRLEQVTTKIQAYNQEGTV